MTSKFKVGDKVVPVSKSFGDSFDKCKHAKKLKANEVNFLYVVGFEGELILLNSDKAKFNAGSYYKEEDLKKFISKNQRIAALEETVTKQGEEISELKLIVAQIRKPSTVIEEALTAATSVEDTPKRLTVGDIAKITGNKSPHNLEIGDIVKIVYDDNDHMPYKAERISDGKESLWLDEADLEPYTNDTIEFEGAQYKKVDREAREGDVVVVKKLTYNLSEYIKTQKPYLVLPDVMITDEDSDGYKGTFNVYAPKYGRTPETVDVYELMYGYNPRILMVDETPIKSPNEKRAEMIEKAKMFIEKSKNSNGYYSVYDNNDGISFPQIPFRCKVEFIVNEEKRTVIALMRGFQSNRVLAKGIAKCMPGDVFNKYIGMAIALGRALGLDVSEFEQAVQPNEVVIGHVATHEGSELDYMITEIDGDMYYTEPGSHYHKGSFVDGSARIINDTNAIYGSVEK